MSFFLFGPRGTGKTSWLKAHFPKSVYIDLLDDEIFNQLLSNPKNLRNYIDVNKAHDFIIIDEIQKAPKLLDEVHRLIESENYSFILTGSNARKLKRAGSNLLGGRAHTYEMFPLTALELEEDFNLKQALQFGTLPMAVNDRNDPKKFLQSYIKTYLKEEIQLEGLTRNIESFARFLQVASFSQGTPLVISNIASEAGINRKVVEDYFSILKDLLISVELPVFSKRAKRDLIVKRKFYFFDSGVYRAIRPKGPLDSDQEIDGFALETLVLNELRVLNAQFALDYEIYYWRTRDHKEVDFILYGENGFHAFEIKSSSRVTPADLVGLKEFRADYPEVKAHIIYAGSEMRVHDNIEYIPINIFFKNALSILRS